MSRQHALSRHLRIATSFLGLAASMMIAERAAAEVVSNPLSQFPITVDGQFSGGLTGGIVQGEWSGVTPLAFISPIATNGTLQTTNLGNPAANSLLYAAIAPGVAQTAAELYLMYDYLPRLSQVFTPGEFLADITFPVRNCAGHPVDESVMATVQFRGISILAAEADEPAKIILPYEVFVVFQGSSTRFPAAQFDIEGALGFGPSTLSLGAAHVD